MDFAKVIVKSNKKEAEKIKELLKSLKDHNPTMVVNHFRFGELGGELLVSFNINNEFHEMVLSKLLLNKMNIWSHDPVTKKLLAKINDTMIKGTSFQNKVDGWNEIRKQGNEETPEQATVRIEKLVQAGRYEEIMKLSKDFRNKAIADIAKERLAEAAGIAIDRMAALALTKKYEADNVIKELLALGGDQSLLNMGRSDITEKAGQAAIDICANYNDFTWDMLKIITDSKLSKVINLRAAAKFSTKVFEDPETFNVEIENAVKNINTKWLDLNMQSVEHLLTAGEVRHINELISYIKSRRV